MEISLFNPDCVPSTLVEFLDDNRPTMAEVVDIVTTLWNNNTYIGGGGASPVWAVKQREPNDAILHLVPGSDGWRLVERETPVDDAKPIRDDLIVDEAIDAALKAIQDRLGVTDGGFAGQYFTPGCEEEERLRSILTEYLQAQRLHNAPDDEPAKPADPRAAFPVGARVRFKQEIDQFPHTIVRAGEAGKITEHGTHGDLWVQLDRYHDGLHEWHNALHMDVSITPFGDYIEIVT